MCSVIVGKCWKTNVYKSNKKKPGKISFFYSVLCIKLNFLSFNYIYISVRKNLVSPFDNLYLWRSIVYALNVLTIIVCLVKCMWCPKSNIFSANDVLYKTILRPLSTVNNDVRHKIITLCYADVFKYYPITNAHAHFCTCFNKPLDWNHKRTSE